MLMGSYEKLAILLLRVVAACWTFFLCVGWAIYGLEMAVGINVQRYPAHTIFGNVGYIFMGLLGLFLSKPVGRLLGRNLDEQA
jgi:hypothetical protein